MTLGLEHSYIQCTLQFTTLLHFTQITLFNTLYLNHLKVLYFGREGVGGCLVGERQKDVAKRQWRPLQWRLPANTGKIDHKI